jgi:ubiquinone biosynthesis protein
MGLSIRKLGYVGRTYRHAQRYRQILAVLLKYGFDDILKSLKLGGLRRLSPGSSELAQLSTPVLIRKVLEDLGPTFVKAGQLLSTRPDLLPVGIMHELAHLQDQVAPIPFDQVEKIIERELQQPLGEVFSELDREPLAAASLGQVHHARTVEGREVAVKVLRPGVHRTVEVDLEIMLYLATLMERHLEGWDVHRPTRIVEELTVLLEKELDYRIEAASQERFGWQFLKDPNIHVPEVLRNHTTASVLTQEFIHGVKAANAEALEEYGLEPTKLAAAIADATMHQLFVTGFFHGDPHPGNLLITSEGVIAYLDFGMMGRIGRRSRETFSDLMTAIVQRNEEAMADALVELCDYEEEPDRAVLERELGDYADRYFFQALKHVHMAEGLNELLELAAEHRLTMPANLFLMIKALSNIEGSCRRLDPDFQITEHAAPFFRRLALDRLHPSRLARDFADVSTEMLSLGREIPHQLSDVLKQLRSGNLIDGLELRGLMPLVNATDRAGNRLAFAIVLAGLIVGSSIIVVADAADVGIGLSRIALVGFSVAAVIGFWLLVSILRRRGM